MMKTIKIEDQAFQKVMLKLDAIHKAIQPVRREENGAGPQIEILGQSGTEVYVDRAKACNLLHLSSRTIQRLTAQKRLNPTMVSNRNFYRLTEIKDLFDVISISFSRERREYFISEYHRLMNEIR